MIRMLTLAVAIAVPIVSAAPQAIAYDPCVRATRDYQRALAEYEDAQRCTRNRFVCNVPQAEARRLNDARARMRDACR